MSKQQTIIFKVLLLSFICFIFVAQKVQAAPSPPPPPALNEAPMSEVIPEINKSNSETNNEETISSKQKNEEKAEEKTEEKKSDETRKLSLEQAKSPKTDNSAIELNSEAKQLTDKEESKDVSVSTKPAPAAEKKDNAQLRRRKARENEAKRRGKNSIKKVRKKRSQRHNRAKKNNRKRTKKKRIEENDEDRLVERISEAEDNSNFWIIGGASALAAVSTLFGALGVWGIYLASTTFGADMPMAAIAMMAIGLIGTVLSGGPLGVLLVDIIAAMQLEGGSILDKSLALLSESDVSLSLGALSWCGLPIVGIFAALIAGAVGIFAPQLTLFFGGAACGAASCALVANVAAPLVAGFEVSSWFELKRGQSKLDESLEDLKKQEEELRHDRNTFLIKSRKKNLKNRNQEVSDKAPLPKNPAKMSY